MAHPVALLSHMAHPVALAPLTWHHSCLCLLPLSLLPPAAVLLWYCRYRFQQGWLVEEALTHCSWAGVGSRCYQRLVGGWREGGPLRQLLLQPHLPAHAVV